MAAITAIVLADGTTPTPVNRTFAPVGVGGDDIARYEDRSAGVLSAMPEMSLQVTRRNKASPVRRVNARLVLPVGTDAQGNKLENVYEIKARIANDGSLAGRADGAAFVKNLASHPALQSALKDLEGVW